MAEIVLTLFTGPQCGLCEQAFDLLAPQLRAPYRCQRVDVTTSFELKKRYGLSIPVLRREDSGAELKWPFNSDQLGDFLAGVS
jgi:Glutaredoxin-like domain (DUF836)